MRHIFYILALGVFLALIAFQDAIAEETKVKSFELQEIVVVATPTRQEGLLKDAPSKVTVISGEKMASLSSVASGAIHRSERSTGQFTRAMTLPFDVASDKVKATYTDGLLKIVLPKAEEAKPKQISVSVS